MQRTHGIATATDGSTLHFGIALWPYDLLLRFGYDLPENEHLWAGKWFDDRFERAALDLRSFSAKLARAVTAMEQAIYRLRDVGGGDAPIGDPRLLAEAVEQTPLALDLVCCYIQRLLDQIAAIIPCCYGQDGRVLIDARDRVQTLAAAPALARLDPALATLLEGAPTLDFPTNRPDLYVIAGSDGYRAALPKAAGRALRASAAVTLTAATRIDETLQRLCHWCDAVLHHLQQVVAGRCEPGPELLARWSEPNWSVLLRFPSGETAVEAHFPRM